MKILRHRMKCVSGVISVNSERIIPFLERRFENTRCFTVFHIFRVQMNALNVYILCFTRESCYRYSLQLDFDFVKMSGFKAQPTVSQLIRTGKGGGGVDERKTRDSFRREKVLYRLKLSV